MFRAIGRFFKAMGYAMTGRIDEARKTMNSDPNVIRAVVDEEVEQMRHNAREYSNSIAGRDLEKTKKRSKIIQLSQEIADAEKVRASARQRIAARATELAKAGKNSAEEMAVDQEMQKHRDKNDEKSKEITSKQTLVDQLKAGIVEDDKQIDSMMLNLRRQNAQIEKTGAKADELISRVIQAQEEKRQHERESGLAAVGSNSKVLQEIEEGVARTESQARVAGMLAGADTKNSDAQYLDAYRDPASDDEFAALIAHAVKTEDAAKAPAEKAAGTTETGVLN